MAIKRWDGTQWVQQASNGGLPLGYDYTTVVTSAGTDTLNYNSQPNRFYTGTTTHTITLPSTSVVAGQTFTITNLSTGTLTVNASGGSNVIYVSSKTSVSLTTTSNAPTLSTQWNAVILNSAIFICTSTTRMSSPVEGQVVYETDTKTINIYDGSAWIRWGGVVGTTAGPQSTTVSSHFGNGSYAMAAGNVTVVPTGTSYALTAYTFPTSRFSVAPIVSATLSSAQGGTQRLIPRVNAITSSGCDVYCYTGDASNWSTGNQIVNIIAVQMVSNGAAG